MRLAFAGTPVFAKVAYEALLKAGYQIPLVLTQPDRPSGRGLKLTPSPVKEAALLAGADVLQVQSLRLDGKYPEDALRAQQALQDCAPDVLVVAAYGLILPQWVLSLPRLGCLNIHASLLPRWRGAAPIQRAIEAGDDQTGITIMQMDQGLDTGAMWLSRSIPITPTSNAALLHDQLAELGGQMIIEVLQDIVKPAPLLSCQAQPELGVCYAAKLDKSEAVLDMSLSALELVRKIHAFNPVPGAMITLPNYAEPIKVWNAQVVPVVTSLPPGSVVQINEQGIDLATGAGVLRLLEVQKPGAKRQSVQVFVRGMSLT